MISVKTQRKIAKAGVLTTMGVLLLTGMGRPRRRYLGLHTWAGVALLGFTFWHWNLYGPRPEKQTNAVPTPKPVPLRRPQAGSSGG
jgi:hypothetical protein